MALDSDIAHLKINPLLALFDDEALRLVAFSTELRTMREGDTLFREGDVSDGAWFIESGAVQLTGTEGEATHGLHALVGEAALFAETKRPATAIVTERGSFRRVPRHLVRRVLSEYPDTAARLRDYFAERVDSAGASLRRIHALLPD
jgi:CRP-like cAMP-binding protein